MRTTSIKNQVNSTSTPRLGYHAGFEDVYEEGEELGKGGFGAVEKVKHKQTGEIFACKKISKTLSSNIATTAQQKKHLENVEREVCILKALKGSLNIVSFEGVYEDAENIYIIMECCLGGELLHTIGLRPYTEATVIRIMRAVLRTLAQCHDRNILHRDIKPGNFMFSKPDVNSAVKAIDFGLAVFSEGPDVPRTDVGFDGTPWFMAPEVLSSQVVAASDIWSAGVMAYQLLSGLLPFDDRKCRHAPALSAVWKSVLSDEPDFSRRCWNEVSQEAKDFIKSLLKKDPKQRPTAVEALSHVWFTKDRTLPTTRNLSHTIVQRIQRFGQSSLFKRTVLDMIANELLNSYVEKTLYNAKKFSSLSCDQDEETLMNGGRIGGSEYDQSKAMRILGSLSRKKSWKSQTDLSMLSQLSLEDWQESKKASRLALDTSSHGSDALLGYMELSNEDNELNENPQSPPVKIGLSVDSNLGKSPSTVAQALQAVLEQEPDEVDAIAQEERGARGKSFYKDFVEAQGGLLQQTIEETDVSIPSPFDQKAARMEHFMSTVFGINDAEEVQKVMEYLNIGLSSNTTEAELVRGLGKLGYDVDKHEIACLLEIMSPGGHDVNFTQFIASQIDWETIQQNHKEAWLECVKHTFQAIDKDHDGKLSTSDIIEAIAEKLPNKEDIDVALDQARAEACAAEMNMSFEDFLTLLTDNSHSFALTRFDSRYNDQVGTTNNEAL